MGKSDKKQKPKLKKAKKKEYKRFAKSAREVGLVRPAYAPAQRIPAVAPARMTMPTTKR